jgi:arsenate reductase (thioredoxin)
MKTILFLCPHNAAKSIIATMYAQRLASAAHLQISVKSRGTEPDEGIMPSVQRLLEADGFDVSAHRPRLVTSADLEQADFVVTMGCDLETLGVQLEKRRDWSDVPPASADVLQCRQAILRHLLSLLAEISHRR